MIREIVELGNPLLRTASRPVADPRGPAAAALARDLLDTLRDFRRRTGYGRDIAAPQIGVMERMVVIDIPDGRREVFVNPVISEQSSETDLVWDACFSYWGFFFQVDRAHRVTVDHLDLTGCPCRLEAEGDLAVQRWVTEIRDDIAEAPGGEELGPPAESGTRTGKG